MKTAIILSTAFITTTGHNAGSEERINQYIKGLKQIAEVVKKYPDFDVYIADCTVEDESKLDGRLLNALNNIPTLKGKILFFNNELGKKNKGAGLIIAWREFLARIKTPYEYIICFEPRQELSDFSFFDRFVNKPGSYFKYMYVKAKKFRIFPIHLHQVITAFESFRKKDFELYCNSVDLDKMVEKKISIEDDLYNFLSKNKIPYEKVERLGVIWHDSANDKYIEL